MTDEKLQDPVSQKHKASATILTSIKSGLGSNIFDRQARAIDVLHSKISCGILGTHNLASDRECLTELLVGIQQNLVPLLLGEKDKRNISVVVVDGTERLQDKNAIGKLLVTAGRLLGMVCCLESGRRNLVQCGAVPVLQSVIEASAVDGFDELATARKICENCLHVLLSVSPDLPHPEFAARVPLKLTAPLSLSTREHKVADSKEETKSAQGSNSVRLKSWTFPVIDISNEDAKVLCEVGMRLRMHGEESLRETLSFLTDVLLRDFPAEVFLQHGDILRRVLDLLRSPQDHVSRSNIPTASAIPSSAKSDAVSKLAVQFVSQLVGNLQQRFNEAPWIVGYAHLQTMTRQKSSSTTYSNGASNSSMFPNEFGTDGAIGHDSVQSGALPVFLCSDSILDDAHAHKWSLVDALLLIIAEAFPLLPCRGLTQPITAMLKTAIDTVFAVEKSTLTSLSPQGDSPISVSGVQLEVWQAVQHGLQQHCNELQDMMSQILGLHAASLDCILFPGVGQDEAHDANGNIHAISSLSLLESFLKQFNEMASFEMGADTISLNSTMQGAVARLAMSVPLKLGWEKLHRLASSSFKLFATEKGSRDLGILEATVECLSVSKAGHLKWSSLFSEKTNAETSGGVHSEADHFRQYATLLVDAVTSCEPRDEASLQLLTEFLLSTVVEFFPADQSAGQEDIVGVSELSNFCVHIIVLLLTDSNAPSVLEVTVRWFVQQLDNQQKFLHGLSGSSTRSQEGLLEWTTKRVLGLLLHPKVVLQLSILASSQHGKSTKTSALAVLLVESINLLSLNDGEGIRFQSSCHTRVSCCNFYSAMQLFQLSQSEPNLPVDADQLKKNIIPTKGFPHAFLRHCECRHYVQLLFSAGAELRTFASKHLHELLFSDVGTFSDAARPSLQLDPLAVWASMPLSEFPPLFSGVVPAKSPSSERSVDFDKILNLYNLVASSTLDSVLRSSARIQLLTLLQSKPQLSPQNCDTAEVQLLNTMISLCSNVKSRFLLLNHATGESSDLSSGELALTMVESLELLLLFSCWAPFRGRCSIEVVGEHENLCVLAGILVTAGAEHSSQFRLAASLLSLVVFDENVWAVPRQQVGTSADLAPAKEILVPRLVLQNYNFLTTEWTPVLRFRESQCTRSKRAASQPNAQDELLNAGLLSVLQSRKNFYECQSATDRHSFVASSFSGVVETLSSAATHDAFDLGLEQFSLLVTCDFTAALTAARQNQSWLAPLRRLVVTNPTSSKDSSILIAILGLCSQILRQARFYQTCGNILSGDFKELLEWVTETIISLCLLPSLKQIERVEEKIAWLTVGAPGVETASGVSDFQSTNLTSSTTHRTTWLNYDDYRAFTSAFPAGFSLLQATTLPQIVSAIHQRTSRKRTKRHPEERLHLFSIQCVRECVAVACAFGVTIGSRDDQFPISEPEPESRDVDNCVAAVGNNDSQKSWMERAKAHLCFVFSKHVFERLGSTFVAEVLQVTGYLSRYECQFDVLHREESFEDTSNFQSQDLLYDVLSNFLVTSVDNVMDNNSFQLSGIVEGCVNILRQRLHSSRGNQQHLISLLKERSSISLGTTALDSSTRLPRWWQTITHHTRSGVVRAAFGLIAACLPHNVISEELVYLCFVTDALASLQHLNSINTVDASGTSSFVAGAVQTMQQAEFFKTVRDPTDHPTTLVSNSDRITGKLVDVIPGLVLKCLMKQASPGGSFHHLGCLLGVLNSIAIAQRHRFACSSAQNLHANSNGVEVYFEKILFVGNLNSNNRPRAAIAMQRRLNLPAIRRLFEVLWAPIRSPSNALTNENLQRSQASVLSFFDIALRNGVLNSENFNLMNLAKGAVHVMVSTSHAIVDEPNQHSTVPVAFGAINVINRCLSLQSKTPGQHCGLIAEKQVTPFLQFLACALKSCLGQMTEAASLPAKFVTVRTLSALFINAMCNHKFCELKKCFLPVPVSAQGVDGDSCFVESNEILESRRIMWQSLFEVLEFLETVALQPNAPQATASTLTLCRCAVRNVLRWSSEAKVLGVQREFFTAQIVLPLQRCVHRVCTQPESVAQGKTVHRRSKATAATVRKQRAASTRLSTPQRPSSQSRITSGNIDDRTPKRASSTKAVSTPLSTPAQRKVFGASEITRDKQKESRGDAYLNILESLSLLRNAVLGPGATNVLRQLLLDPAAKSRCGTASPSHKLTTSASGDDKLCVSPASERINVPLLQVLAMCIAHLLSLKSRGHVQRRVLLACVDTLASFVSRHPMARRALLRGHRLPPSLCARSVQKKVLSASSRSADKEQQSNNLQRNAAYAGKAFVASLRGDGDADPSMSQRGVSRSSFSSMSAVRMSRVSGALTTGAADLSLLDLVLTHIGTIDLDCFNFKHIVASLDNPTSQRRQHGSSSVQRDAQLLPVQVTTSDLLTDLKLIRYIAPAAQCRAALHKKHFLDDCVAALNRLTTDTLRAGKRVQPSQLAENPVMKSSVQLQTELFRTITCLFGHEIRDATGLDTTASPSSIRRPSMSYAGTIGASARVRGFQSLDGVWNVVRDWLSACQDALTRRTALEALVDARLLGSVLRFLRTASFCAEAQNLFLARNFPVQILGILEPLCQTMLNAGKNSCWDGVFWVAVDTLRSVKLTTPRVSQLTQEPEHRELIRRIHDKLSQFLLNGVAGRTTRANKSFLASIAEEEHGSQQKEKLLKLLSLIE